MEYDLPIPGKGGSTYVIQEQGLLWVGVQVREQNLGQRGGDTGVYSFVL